MANVSVYNMEGNEVGKMDLNDAVFGVEVNEHLVHMAVVAQLANNRQGTQKAKTRSEVSGGGRKPWRQKGTGHARQGSTRALLTFRLFRTFLKFFVLISLNLSSSTTMNLFS